MSSQTESPASSTAVIVLGMHRSGTSCLAGCLQQAGVYLGDVAEWSAANPRGNRESQAIIDLNNSVLESNGGGWRRVPSTPLTWSVAQSSERDRVLAELRGGPGPFWGFKDPRTLLTYPFWTAAIPVRSEVATFRHPLRVAESLHRRSAAISVDEGLHLWQAYNERLLSMLENRPLWLVRFDASPAEYRSQLERLVRGLGLMRSTDQIDFFTPSLRHTRIESDERLVPPPIWRTYERLNAIYESQRDQPPVAQPVTS